MLLGARSKWRSLGVGFVVALGATILTAPAANAAPVIVGDNPLVSTGGGSFSGAANAPVFEGAAPSGYVLSSPVDGTVTSWNFLSGGLTPGSLFALRILRPADASGQSWIAVATSASQPVTLMGDVAQGPFTTNLPIKAGDRIALQAISGSGVPIEIVTGAGIRYFKSAFADGSTAQIDPQSNADTNQLVPVQATVDPSPPPINSKPPSVVGTPKAGQTLSCDPGVWNGAASFSYAWSLTTLTVVSGGAHRPPLIVHTTVSLGTAQSLILGDYRPGSSELSCTVTASNTNGSATASSAPVTVQAVLPALSLVVHLGRKTISPQPHITPGVGVGGTNFCSSGLWAHYPRSFTYAWKLQIGRRAKIISRKQTLTIAGADEGRKLFCVVGAVNGAGVASAKSNSYKVPKTAPVNTGRPAVFGTSTPRPAGSSPPANPGSLDGNSFHLSCGNGRWNRNDLTFSYSWLFDRTGSGSSPAQLTGLSVTGINLAIDIKPPSGPLLINGAPPQIHGRTLYGLDYLDDSVQCMVTARAPNGLVGTALSPVVKLRGPVASL